MDLAVLILLTSRLMTEDVHRRMAAAGFADLRPAHGFAFQLIASTGGATGVELAEHLGVTRQAAGQMVDELVRLGYVGREADPDDARLRRIVLTDRGRQAIAAATELWSAQEREWETLIGAGAMAAVQQGLLAFVEAQGGLQPPLRLRPTW
jgi:DNA-binding MarR family transcriptional regulator